MTTITIKTQAEIEALPDSFNEFTKINIKSTAETLIQINKSIKSAVFVAWGSSHVVAHGSSHVTAWESSHVEAHESSHVEAWGSSHVEAHESSHVEAHGSSHVEAHGSSRVTAWESSHVEAWGSSRVEAWMNASIKIQNNLVVVEKLKQFSVAICIDCSVSAQEQDETAQLITSHRVMFDTSILCSIYRDNCHDGKITLYKSVREDFLDFYSASIKYLPGTTVVCPDWDSDSNRECGGGLHLSPTPGLAQSFTEGKLLECEVDIQDIIVNKHNIAKVRCREVKILREIFNG
jgi:hypothetical protein